MLQTQFKKIIHKLKVYILAMDIMKQIYLLDGFRFNMLNLNEIVKIHLDMQKYMFRYVHTDIYSQTSNPCVKY